MYLLQNNIVVSDNPSSEEIEQAFYSLNSYKDYITLQIDNNNYIEAKKSLLGGFEMSHLCNSEHFISDLNCIKEGVVLDIFTRYNSGSTDAVNILKWKRRDEESSLTKIKNIGWIVLIIVFGALRFGGESFNNKILNEVGGSPFLLLSLITLILVIMNWKYLKNYKLIQGHNKLYATVTIFALFSIMLAWLRSVL